VSVTAASVHPRIDHHVFAAFGGSRCEVVAADSSLDAVSAVVADVYAFEARLTRFRRDSELSMLNARAGERVEVSPLLASVLAATLEAADLTGGLVNAAVLPQLVAAGYDVSIEEVRRRDAGFGAAARGVAHAGMPAAPLGDVLELGPGWARVRAGCAIDLGGVGKGWLADRLAERLENAVVNLGGDLRAVGGGIDTRGWPVELCDGSRLLVRDAGVATSGVRGRRWSGGHHLIDPRTGCPASTDVAAVTVVACDALHAEALAKAAAILGVDDGVPFALRRGAVRVAVERTNVAEMA
jgi:thiamine biosynthesis lipoprotein